MAIEKGRSTRKNLKVGICGEHGGELKSVKFCHTVGMNYVSCSPFRVPIARLASAQAVIEGKASGAKPANVKATTAKKPAAKKVAAKKPVAKASSAKKPAAKKVASKKPVAKKTVAKKPVAKKAKPTSKKK
jgi:pyruvate, orthophosphate dikinase